MLKLGFVYVCHCSGACFAIYIFMILTDYPHLPFVLFYLIKF